MESGNEERFTGKAEVYQQYRASYPKELIEYLYEKAGFNKNSVIADVGSGTGIFSRLLLEKGSRVFCIEPNDDMRLVSESELRRYVKLNKSIFVNAPAENTGLKEKSIDFITAAQAFHWFDRQKFAKECRRILKGGGKVALIWNIRDFNHEIVQKDFVIRKKYSVGDAKGLSSGEKSINEFDGFFLDNIYEESTFANNLRLERNDYIGMNLSRSYAPREDKEPEKYNNFVSDLHMIFDEYSNNGVLFYPHITKCYIGTL